MKKQQAFSYIIYFVILSSLFYFIADYSFGKSIILGGIASFLYYLIMVKVLKEKIPNR